MKTITVGKVRKRNNEEKSETRKRLKNDDLKICRKNMFLFLIFAKTKSILCKIAKIFWYKLQILTFFFRFFF